jgi:hypothetical protein
VLVETVREEDEDLETTVVNNNDAQVVDYGMLFLHKTFTWRELEGMNLHRV